MEPYEKNDAPWLKSYGEVKFHLDYPQKTMWQAVFDTAEKYPKETALSFMDCHVTYAELKRMITLCARSFHAAGVRENDVVTICMPNVPQAVYCLYAVNMLGAKASMIHPLSAENEIAFYIDEVKSRFVITLDMFYYKIENVLDKVSVEKVIVSSIADGLDFPLSLGYRLTQERKIKKAPENDKVMSWKRFISAGNSVNDGYVAYKNKDDGAVILFSGGTTGTTKGILLTNYNFNALAVQTAAMCNKRIVKTSMLAAMPVFHGFGLGVCVHTMLVAGGRSILVPRFNVSSYAKLLKKEKPNYIAGVPTLYKAITQCKDMDGVKLDCLMGVFSGGDNLSTELKREFDKFLSEHGASVRVREGYGMTECVAASCLTPYHIEKEGSIGLPYPDTYYKICKVGTTKTVNCGEEGEICLCGPTVMKEYIGKSQETEDTLRVHEDGKTWLHTGDLGVMDEDGFVYFRQRMKRMIVTSGYNVYPSQIEKILEAHKAVQMSCVIGVKDEYKMQKVKAFVVLNEGYGNTPQLKQELFEHCKKHIAKYAMPYEIEVRHMLPKTLVGKVAYRQLEKEEAERNEK